MLPAAIFYLYVSMSASKLLIRSYWGQLAVGLIHRLLTLLQAETSRIRSCSGEEFVIARFVDIYTLGYGADLAAIGESAVGR